MQKTKIIYWIFTILLSVAMILSSIPDIIVTPDAITIFKHLGYPEYLIRFTGIAKLLAVIAILFPGLPRLKEWAYAGLFFDLTGAVYGGLAVGDPIVKWLPLGIIFGLILGSQYYHHKLLTARGQL